MRKFYLIIAFSFFGFIASAQNISFGAKAGMNLSSLRGEESYDFQSKIGFHIGVFAHFSFTDWFALQGEILYSRQGAKKEITIVDVDFQDDPIIQGGENVTVNFNLDYINIPILAKFYPTSGFNLFLGPQVGFLVSAHEKVRPREYEGPKNDISEILRELDFGLVGGIGYDFDFGMTLQARYYLGLINLNKVKYVFENGTSSHPKLKNNGFQLSVGYWF